MKTAFLGKIMLAVFPNVYEPSDDSFLLAQSVSVKNCASVLDLGTGTGIQGINAAMHGAARVVCTDTSKEALENAGHNARQLGIIEKFDFRKGSLFECIKPKEKFDLIIFNPPYVPTGEKKFHDLDGGKQGRETLDKFLAQFPSRLKERGQCFFLQSSLNSETKTGQMLQKQGLSFKAVARKRLFFEELIAFKAWKKKP